MNAPLADLAPRALAPLEIGTGEAHVWYCCTARCAAPALLDAYRALLDDGERARMARFAFEHLKLEYLLTRALCRSTLSRYAPSITPAQWRFRSNAYGRPEPDLPQAPSWLRFNLSNARTLIACVVTRDCDAGVDVEETARRGDVLGIADAYFSPRELADLRALPAAAQLTRFFDLWTLKESYIKARGMGLAIPLDRFSFVFDADRIGIAFAPSLDDAPEQWHFELHRPSAEHTLAVGVRGGSAAPLRVSVREVVPLAADAG